MNEFALGTPGEYCHITSLLSASMEKVSEVLDENGTLYTVKYSAVVVYPS